MTDKPMAEITLGILGVGYFASYFIAGLRKGGFSGAINLSPRSKETAHNLASKYACTVAGSNQEVIDQSDIVLLSVRPEQITDLLGDLNFRAEQTVISAIAGISLEAQRESGNLPTTFVRMIPVCCIEAGEGVVPIYPPNQMAQDLASYTGAPITFEKEEEFDLSLAASCMNGWLYEFFGNMSSWMESKGLPPETARQLILHNIRGATGYALLKEDENLAGITDGIATEGTYTLKGLEVLREQQGISAWNQALDEVYTNLIKDN